MQEICKSGSVRGIEVFSYGSNIVTLRKPKGRRNREYKINLNAGDHIMSTRPKMLFENLIKLESVMLYWSLMSRSGC